MSEHKEQVELFNLIRKHSKEYPLLRFAIAYPAGGERTSRESATGARYSPEGQRLRAEGMAKGFPDVLLLVPSGEYSFAAVEMKHGTNKPTKEQWEWIDDLRAHRALVAVCYTGTDAFKFFCRYLEGNPIQPPDPKRQIRQRPGLEEWET